MGVAILLFFFKNVVKPASQELVEEHPMLAPGFIKGVMILVVILVWPFVLYDEIKHQYRNWKYKTLMRQLKKHNPEVYKAITDKLRDNGQL